MSPVLVQLYCKCRRFLRW